MRYYYDVDFEKVYSDYDLEKMYNDLRKNVETEIETYSQYINECVSKNGTLIQLVYVSQFPLKLKLKAFKAIKKYITENTFTSGSLFSEMLRCVMDGKTSDLPYEIIDNIFHDGEYAKSLYWR